MLDFFYLSHTFSPLLAIKTENFILNTFFHKTRTINIYVQQESRKKFDGTTEPNQNFKDVNLNITRKEI